MTHRQLPLLASPDLGAPFAWRDGVPISGRQFLADAAAQADLLPAHGSMVNLCGDRYQFTVAFAAALMRGQACLLPPDALPATLARLGQSGLEGEVAPGAAYGLTEDPVLRADGLPMLRASAAHSPPAAVGIPSLGSDQVAAVLLTSGSTGAPTPHSKTFGVLAMNIAAAARRLAHLLEMPSLAGLNIVATVPPQHSYGFESSVLLAMLGGAAIDSGRPYYPADIAAALDRLPRPRALVTTPFHLKALLLADVALPDVDLVLSATAPLSPQLAALAERRFGGQLIEIYGCTEAGQVATRRPVRSPVWHAFDGLRVYRQDAQEGGSFMAFGGHVTLPTPLADILELDDAHHFRLLGRSNDLIHVAGRRNSLAHLEHHLNSIEGVEDGAFWLPPDAPDSVVRPIAFVVAPSLTSAQLIGQLRSRLEAVFVPRRVIHVAALPREATGKLTRRKLGEMAIEHGFGSPT